MAQNSYSRILGLMFKKSLPKNRGLLLIPCNSIHTFFMRFPIDVIFLNKHNTIVGIYRNLKPWRITKIFFTAKKVLELPANSIPADVILEEKLILEHPHYKL